MGGAEQGEGRGLQPAFLTCALAILEPVARLAGQRLVAVEGAHRVHAVLAAAARVQVCHALVDVCGEEGPGRQGLRGGPGDSANRPALPSREQQALCHHPFNKDLWSTCLVPAALCLAPGYLVNKTDRSPAMGDTQRKPNRYT